MSRMFQISKPFESLQDYADYPHSKLYWHGKLIGKAITDNWQFCRIKAGIENGGLLKAELAEGYKYYNCDTTIIARSTYASELDEFNYHETIIARSALEAKAKVILDKCNYFHFEDGDVQILVDAYTIDKE